MLDSDICANLSFICLAATGSYVESRWFEYCCSSDDVRGVLRDWRINRWGELLEREVKRVLNGDDREYFLDEHEWSKQYRRRRHLDKVIEARLEQSTGLLTWEESADLFLAELERSAKEVEAFGASLFAYRESGWACNRERVYFYQTDEWKRCAAAARFVAGYQCASCGNRNSKLHVHHHAPVLSMFSHAFSNNFADYKLEALCEDCHVAYHANAVRDDLSYNFHIGDAQEVAKMKTHLQVIQRAHDRAGGCEFCRMEIDKRYPPP